MWQVKMATKMAGMSGNIPGMKKFSKYARWAGLSTAATFLILGILAVIIGAVQRDYLKVAIGFYCMLISGFLGILEVPWTPLDFLVSTVNIFADYKWRIALFIVIAIPSFFVLITILAGIASVVTAGFYGFCLFKGESGETIKQEQGEGGKKKSLASQDSVV